MVVHGCLQAGARVGASLAAPFSYQKVFSMNHKFLYGSMLIMWVLSEIKN